MSSTLQHRSMKAVPALLPKRTDRSAHSVVFFQGYQRLPQSVKLNLCQLPSLSILSMREPLYIVSK